MTRINVINPSMLSDKHLGAEYRELPRVFGLVREAIKRGERPYDSRNPREYVLGTGHVRFFYPRLGYLVKRYEELCRECRTRGRVVNFGDSQALSKDIPSEWFGEFKPSTADEELNIERINMRGTPRNPVTI